MTMLSQKVRIFTEAVYTVVKNIYQYILCIFMHQYVYPIPTLSDNTKKSM